MAILSREFYNHDTVEVAKALLGKYIVRHWKNEFLIGRITETEAYIGRCDKACHAYNYRRTERTDPLFMPPGHAYIYLIYGMYHCLNFVTEPDGEPAAVLIRGVEPLYGIDTMLKLRFGDNALTPYRMKNFMNGPGKVCAGLSLTRAENRVSLTGTELFVCDSPTDLGLSCPALPKERIVSGPRIGIDYAEEAREFPWRFFLQKEEV